MTMDFKQFNLALNQIAEEKGIAKEKILETIEMALAAAYKKDYGKKGQIIRAKFDPETGSVVFQQIKIVLDESMLKPEVPDEEAPAEEGDREREIEIFEEFEEGQPKKVRFNPERHIMIEEARQINSESNPGDELAFPLEAKADYGRIAAQTAKQVITQRIREAERDVIFDEFKSKQGEVASGIVQRVEGGKIFVDMGRTVGLMFPEERIPGEHYRLGSRIRVYILSVDRLAKGPSILLSRSHPRLVSKLFEMEVPEIASGVVEIKSIAREAGSRTKVAVTSSEKGVDPIGSLVGQKGTRVSTVINELGGEKIDIVEWSQDTSKFVGSAMNPAKVVEVEINEKHHEARVLVPEDQLSLAIGKGGQNVRLAAKLTGWKIDVRSASSPEKTIEGGTSIEAEDTLGMAEDEETPSSDESAPPPENEEQAAKSARKKRASKKSKEEEVKKAEVSEDEKKEEKEAEEINESEEQKEEEPSAESDK